MKQHKSAAQVKQFIKSDYSKFWINEVHRYGLTPYHTNLLSLISSLTRPEDGCILEVGVGTGWPFAQMLVKEGYSVYGVDIAELLIDEASSSIGRYHCIVADGETLPLSDKTFAIVYCFQATWYFPNLDQLLSELARVTRPGGIFMFDVMNLASRRIISVKLPPRYRWAMSSIKRTLMRRPLLPPPFDHEHPTTPWRVNLILRSLPVRWHVVLPEDPQRPAAWFDYLHYRLVYVCRRHQS